MTNSTKNRETKTTQPLLAVARNLPDFKLPAGIPDVRGWAVLAQDESKIGEVSRLLVDPKNQDIRYLEVSLDGAVAGARTLIPAGFARAVHEKLVVMVRVPTASVLNAGPRFEGESVAPEIEASIVKAFGSDVTLSSGSNRYDHPMFHFGTLAAASMS